MIVNKLFKFRNRIEESMFDIVELELMVECIGFTGLFLLGLVWSVER